MKNAILLTISAVFSLLFYYAAFPLTSAIIISSSLYLPAELVGVSIFIPGIVYFLIIFSVLFIKKYLHDRKKDSTPTL